MPEFRVLKTIYETPIDYKEPGDTIEITDEGEIKRLMGKNAIASSDFNQNEYKILDTSPPPPAIKNANVEVKPKKRR
jgi:hypothetical protein